jgi:hypothetical protein
MIVAMNAWLGLTVVMGACALFAILRHGGARWGVLATLTFIWAAIASYALLQAPMGFPDYDPLPDGEFTILGARIDVDEAIYIMIDGPQPHLYKLPYSASDADKLQKGMDAVANGEAGAMMGKADGSQGAVEFYEAPVAGDEEKTPEVPQIQGG